MDGQGVLSSCYYRLSVGVGNIYFATFYFVGILTTQNRCPVAKGLKCNFDDVSIDFVRKNTWDASDTQFSVK